MISFEMLRCLAVSNNTLQHYFSTKGANDAIFTQSLFGQECSMSADGLALVVGAPRLTSEVSVTPGLAVVLRRQSRGEPFSVQTENIQYLSPLTLRVEQAVESLGGISVDMDSAGTVVVVGRPGDRLGRYGGKSAELLNVKETLLRLVPNAERMAFVLFC